MNPERLRELLKSRKIAERIQAAQVLDRYNGEDRDELALKALNDSNKDIASLGAEALKTATNLQTAMAMLAKF